MSSGLMKDQATLALARNTPANEKLMFDTEIVDVQELNDRLTTVEGKILALTFLLRRLVEMPKFRVNKLWTRERAAH
jgi:hypothetical protein